MSPAAQPSSASAPAPYSHFLRVDGLVRHARVYPPAVPGGGPIVVVPGLGCAYWMYHRLARRLAAERTVWVYDHPGMGLSAGRGRSGRGAGERIERLTDGLADWLRARGLHGAPLLGHSLGGEIGIDLAARYPELCGPLILCAPTGIPDNPNVTAQLIRLALDLPRERLGLLPLAISAYLRAGARRLYRLAHDQDRHQTGPLIPEVRVPALVMDGSDDPVIRAWTLDLLCDQLPSARACTIRGGTHALMDSHPRQVARETLRFLREVEAGTFTPEKVDGAQRSSHTLPGTRQPTLKG